MLQLQFFNHATRSYAPSSGVVNGAVANMAVLADYARQRGAPWRIAKPERPLRPVPYRPYVSKAPSRDIATVQREYVKWAALKGIRITVYAADFAKHKNLGRFPEDSKIITPEEHFAVEETTE